MTENWYAIFVITGQEDKTKMYLEKIYEGSQRFLVPKRRLKERRGGVWHEVTKTLYPGYVLVQGELTNEDCHVVRNVPGVVRLLANKEGPMKIDDEEIYILKSLVGIDGIIEYSDAIVEGSSIIITEGPLVSREGLVHSVNRRKGRAKIRIRMFGEERLVELGINFLLPSD